MIKTTLEIDGMMCAMCEAHINDTIRKAFPVKKVTSSAAKNQTEIFSDEPIDEAALHKAIDPTGYRLLSVKSEPYEKKGFRLFHR